MKYTVYTSADGWLHAVTQHADGWAESFKRGEKAPWTHTAKRYRTAQDAQRALDAFARRMDEIAPLMQMRPLVVSDGPVRCEELNV